VGVLLRVFVVLMRVAAMLFVFKSMGGRGAAELCVFVEFLYNWDKGEWLYMHVELVHLRIYALSNVHHQDPDFVP